MTREEGRKEVKITYMLKLVRLFSDRAEICEKRKQRREGPTEWIEKNREKRTRTLKSKSYQVIAEERTTEGTTWPVLLLQWIAEREDF
jgi:hypothetical protein